MITFQGQVYLATAVPDLVAAIMLRGQLAPDVPETSRSRQTTTVCKLTWHVACPFEDCNSDNLTHGCWQSRV